MATEAAALINRYRPTQVQPYDPIMLNATSYPSSERIPKTPQLSAAGLGVEYVLKNMRLAHEEPQENDDRNRNAKHPEDNAAHDFFLLC
ncbi:hypothetical protein [Oryzicola mucosus]|uniref:Uncharacterized protein n=1 Tax=Oryzicola mucosus TaxID=2767425 RepID=A0A8J6U5P2_9HYPH|nr:hypothetical protein [Oryzicola mucosus]MBD0416665.1 hypothetical protein [Oryzicola mucosus]